MNRRTRRIDTAEIMRLAALDVAREQKRMRDAGIIDEKGDLTPKGRAKVEEALAISKGTASSRFTGY